MKKVHIISALILPFSIFSLTKHAALAVTVSNTGSAPGQGPRLAGIHTLGSVGQTDITLIPSQALLGEQMPSMIHSAPALRYPEQPSALINPLISSENPEPKGNPLNSAGPAKGRPAVTQSLAQQSVIAGIIGPTQESSLTSSEQARENLNRLYDNDNAAESGPIAEGGELGQTGRERLEPAAAAEAPSLSAAPPSDSQTKSHTSYEDLVFLTKMMLAILASLAILLIRDLVRLSLFLSLISPFFIIPVPTYLWFKKWQKARARQENRSQFPLAALFQAVFVCALNAQAWDNLWRANRILNLPYPQDQWISLESMAMAVGINTALCCAFMVFLCWSWPERPGKDLKPARSQPHILPRP